MMKFQTLFWMKAKIKKNNRLTIEIFGKSLCNSVIITTGTFLRGLIHQGCKSWPAGRIDCKPSTNLAYFFEKHNFKLLRLKTGTPLGYYNGIN